MAGDFMKKHALIQELYRSMPLCWQAIKAETKKIKSLIIFSEANVMLRNFFKAIEANEKDRILSFFATNAIYHNIPMEPVQGQDAIWAVLGSMQDISEEIEWLVHNISVDDAGKVYTERTDRFNIRGKWREIPVMGIFELEDGKITGWRDYFDLQQMMTALSE